MSYAYPTDKGFFHLRLTIPSVACQNYGDKWESKCIPLDLDRDTAAFDQIAQSFRTTKK